MSLSNFQHVYFGSAFCGPHEAFLKLRTNNLLFARYLRTSTLKIRITSRKEDLDLSKECGRIFEIIVDAAETRCKDPRTDPSTNLDIINAGIAAVDGMVLDMIYPMITALCLLRSASMQSVANDVGIKRLLDSAEQIIASMPVLEQTPHIKEVACKRHTRFKKNIALNASFGFYCLISISHNQTEHYPFKNLNKVLESSVTDIILTLDIDEQKEIFNLLGFDAEYIASIYLMKAVQLQKDTAGDLLAMNVLKAHNQFLAFVIKGKNLGIFSGWAETDRFPSRRDTCVNLENPVVVKVLKDANSKLDLIRA